MEKKTTPILGLNMLNRKSMDQSFSDPEPPKLEGIIFAEFDNDIGRVIKYQVNILFF